MFINSGIQKNFISLYIINQKEISQSKKEKPYILGTVNKELIIYDFEMINYKTKERPFTIYDSPKEAIIYYKE